MTTKLQSPYFGVPKILVKERIIADMSETALKLYLHLLAWSEWRGDLAIKVTNKKLLAQSAGISIRSLSKACGELESAKLVTITRQNREAVIFHIDPAPLGSKWRPHKQPRHRPAMTAAEATARFAVENGKSCLTDSYNSAGFSDLPATDSMLHKEVLITAAGCGEGNTEQPLASCYIHGTPSYWWQPTPTATLCGDCKPCPELASREAWLRVQEATEEVARRIGHESDTLVGRVTPEMARFYLEDKLGRKLAKGRWCLTLCPFHSGTRPTLIIDFKKAVWNCFGACQRGGGLIDFEQLLMDWPTRKMASDEIAQLLAL